ncbi:exopolyphosphatase [Desulfocucumis palustris]|uniref:Exopolyphosphatase n=1 Tax=Desulfocucumis palustris TaxID=1898651 RepID=A0A2L2XEW6_9FIRM|nr:HD domain-containing protein [Desulfocucumis palustris]GBF34899.1 exopolyphosphatase [Desulfocucumis palustris]
MFAGNADHIEMVLALGNKYRYDQLHAKTVERLCVAIFDRLGSLHGMGDRELNLLRHAALLHDLGACISIRKHHIHSAYLVMHDETLDSYPGKDREVVALLVRSHRKKVKLDPEEMSRYGREVLPGLIAILRIADILDYFHRGSTVIKDIRVDGNTCTFVVWGIDLEAIREKINKKASYFQEVFKLKVVITNESPEIGGEEAASQLTEEDTAAPDGGEAAEETAGEAAGDLGDGAEQAAAALDPPSVDNCDAKG